MDFKPSIFIGLGGMGKNILLRIRRMIIEDYKKLDNLPSIRFLHADTHTSLTPDAGVNIPLEVLGQRLEFTDTERVNLSSRINSELLLGIDNIKHNKAVSEWFDVSLPIDITFTDGAGGIRPYGRMAFHYAINTFRDKVENASIYVNHSSNIQKTADSLRMPKQNEPGIDIYVVCSFLGGTGSGCFLDACYNALFVTKKFMPRIIGVFTIGGNVKDEQTANCYSALMELGYHSTAFIQGRKQHFNVSYPISVSSISEDDAPCNLCYLLSPIGENYVLNRDEFEEAVALNLYLNFASSIAAAKKGKMIDFTSKDYFRELDSDLKRSKQFLSFGISTLEFPAPRVQDMMAHELASFTLKGWLREEKKESPDLDRDIRDIEETLKENFLIRELQTIDNKNIIQRVNSRLSEQENAVRNLIEESKIDSDLIITTVNSNINTNIESVNFSMDPKLCGEYAREITNKAHDLQRKLSEMIKEKVNNLVESEHRGPREAKAYLSGIHRLLTSKIKVFEDKFNSFQKSAVGAQEPIYTGVRKLREDLGKEKYAMNFHNRKIHSEFLASYMALSLKREVYRAALEILKVDRSENGVPVQSLLSIVNALDGEIDNYIQKLESLSAKLDDRRQEIEFTITGTTIAEGIKLSSARLREIGKSVVPNQSSHITPLLNYTMDALSEKDQNGTKLKQFHILEITRRQDDVESLLIQRCSELCIGVRNISVAKELKDKDNLKDILSNKIRHSMPMIQAGGFKEKEDVRLSWLATSNPEKDPALKQVCSEIFTIKQYADITNKHLQTLPDPYRIIFASEKGIFPLHRITILKEYRKDYRRIKPKHTDIRIDYPDILPATEEDKIKERSEQAVFFGKYFEFLSEKEDPKSGYKHIYLSYFDDASRSMNRNKIVDNWIGFEVKLTKEQVEKEIDKIRTGTTILDKLEELIDKKALMLRTKKEREEEWLRLQRYLKTIEESLEGGDMNPEYQRKRDIIQRLRDKYHIEPPEGHEPPEPPDKQTKKSEELKPARTKYEEAYRKALISHFEKGIKDRDKLLNLGEKFYRLDKETASQIFDEEISNRDKLTLEQRLEEYRKDFELAIMDKEITEEERSLLKEKQNELGLTDEEVRDIEKQYTESMYHELFQLALLDNIIEKHERKQLRNMQHILNLSDEQIENIESDFVFKEES